MSLETTLTYSPTSNSILPVRFKTLEFLSIWPTVNNNEAVPLDSNKLLFTSLKVNVVALDPFPEILIFDFTLDHFDF